MQRCSAVKVGRWRENTTRCALEFLLLANGSEATSNSLKEDEIMKLCRVAKAARGATGIANNRLGKLLDQLQAAAAAEQKLSLAALAAEDNDTALVFEQAAVTAKQCGTEAMNDLKTALPAALIDVTNAAAASGAITELISILQQNGKQGSNTKCLVKSDGQKAGPYRQVTELGCPDVFTKSFGEGQKHDSAVIASTGFAELGTAEQTVTLGGSSDCIFTNGNDAKTAMWGGTSAVSVAAGIIQITPNAAAGATAKVDAKGTQATDYKLTSDGQSPLQQLYKAVTGPIHVPPPNCATSEADLLTQVLDGNKLKVALKPTLIALGQITEQTADTKLKELLDKVAGHETDHAKHLVKLLGQIQAKQVKNKDTEPQDINKLATSNNLPTAAIIAAAKVKIAVVNKITCTSTEERVKNEKTEEEQNKECSTKKEAECTGNCEWDKEKEICKPAQKVEGENKEKKRTTNTTGSNSFVIHRAPLLLAFLILQLNFQKDYCLI
uniref:Variant surface glycoprotein 1125.1709 n=1 Tax=Trypanosoma brucei TaxID=5691 RepID=A0A1J0R7W4_9TRYP|nr:variant surface glycoprotein 1125.1709 [Trypanosoma brucei]